MNPNTTVLCYGGPRHGEWLEVPTHPPYFLVCGRVDDSDVNALIPMYRYTHDEVDVRFDGVRMLVNLAVCESKRERVEAAEIAQFTLGHAIARLAVRPATLRDKYGTEVSRA